MSPRKGELLASAGCGADGSSSVLLLCERSDPCVHAGRRAHASRCTVFTLVTGLCPHSGSSTQTHEMQIPHTGTSGLVLLLVWN